MIRNPRDVHSLQLLKFSYPVHVVGQLPRFHTSLSQQCLYVLNYLLVKLRSSVREDANPIIASLVDIPKLKLESTRLLTASVSLGSVLKQWAVQYLPSLKCL